MVEAGARFSQLLGLPRSTGQIYGLLYLSPRPVSLDEMVELLKISKASASIGTRQLAGWNAIRQVYIVGDRRDYYEASYELTQLIQRGLKDFVRPRLASSKNYLDRITRYLEAERVEGSLRQEDYDICAQRIALLAEVQAKLTSLAPLAEKSL
jgi:HTH-type transcriptional regulator, glycine betaine synthesis regulator